MVVEAWTPLTAEESERYWNSFYFGLHPGASDPLGRLAPEEPTPSVAWDVSPVWNDSDPLLTDVHRSWNTATLAAFRAITAPGSRHLAFDVSHESLWFAPHAESAAPAAGDWPVNVLPDGDYYVFADPELRFGILSDYRDSAVCCFGQDLLDAVGAAHPIASCRPVRRNGQQV